MRAGVGDGYGVRFRFRYASPASAARPAAANNQNGSDFTFFQTLSMGLSIFLAVSSLMQKSVYLTILYIKWKADPTKHLSLDFMSALDPPKFARRLNAGSLSWDFN